MKKLEEHALMAEENSTLSGGFCSTGAVNLKSLLRKMVLVFFFFSFHFLHNKQQRPHHRNTSKKEVNCFSRLKCACLSAKRETTELSLRNSPPIVSETSLQSLLFCMYLSTDDVVIVSLSPVSSKSISFSNWPFPADFSFLIFCLCIFL